MANFEDVIQLIPAEQIRNTPHVVRANLTKAGWEVTMGIGSDKFMTECLLHGKPYRAFLFLIDGEAFDSAHDVVEKSAK